MPEKLGSLLFVTGTDTGVGKTTVAALLCSGVMKCGCTVHVSKPVETGCETDAQGRLSGKDGLVLWAASGKQQPLAQVAPYRFAPPVAPAAAAQAQQAVIDIKLLQQTIHAARENCDLLIVEGAGGLLVPITPQYTYADLARDISAVCLVVVGSRLGAINHALLTFEVLRKREIPAMGYVLNEMSGAADADSAERETGEPTALSTNRVLLSRAAEAYGITELCYVGHAEQSGGVLIGGNRQWDAAQTLAARVIEYFGLKG
ncbi:MAG TPA: dethiobiotin synthase [Oligoflexia bacterium]|nr:dethiobiotin synthase [Oligoflexia bacterium]